MSDTPVSLLDRLRLRPDAAAWQRWIELYRPILKHWLRRPDLQAADVDDVTQDVLVTVVREIARFHHNGRPGAFRNWLRQVTVHRLRDLVRARRHVTPGGWDELMADLESPDGSLSRWWEKEHDQLVLRRLLELMRPEFAESTWEAFRRQVLGEETAEQAAAALGVSVNAARIAKCRVLNRLKQEGQDLLGE